MSEPSEPTRGNASTPEAARIPTGATADSVIPDEEFLPPITKPATAEPLGLPDNRGQFTRDNQAATFKTTAAVVAAAALNLFYEMDTEQVRQILDLLAGKVGLPLLVPVGVALFEFWRRDR